MNDKRREALEIAIGQIDKQFGKGAIMRLGEEQGAVKIGAIPTGSLALDIALGVGGIPRGRVVEIYGAESSGKSTLAYHIMSEAQKSGGTAAYIDAEHALDPGYSARCGVNLDDLLVSQPDSAEQALEICEYLVRSSAVDLVVIDSVAAMVPKAEIDGDMGDTHVGLQARLMSQALRKLTAAIGRSDCAVVFINQIREKVGVIWGSPETTPGGRALKFYSSVRLDLRRAESIKRAGDFVGNRVRARVVKNKVAPPFKTAEFDIMFNEGISREGELLEIGTDMGLVKKSGSFYSFGDVRLGQGRENSKGFLKDNPDVAAKIHGLITGDLSDSPTAPAMPRTSLSSSARRKASPIGHDIDPAMDHDSPFRIAMGRALNLISYRPRSESELRRRLSEHHSEDAVVVTIDRLKDQGLIDDARFAREWSDSRTRRSPRSSRAILRELSEKGIPRREAETAVIDLDDETTAREAAARFARRLTDADYEQFHRRLWGHLQRRGYSRSVARRIAFDLWNRRQTERSDSE